MSARRREEGRILSEEYVDDSMHAPYCGAYAAWIMGFFVFAALVLAIAALILCFRKFIPGFYVDMDGDVLGFSNNNYLKFRAPSALCGAGQAYNFTGGMFSFHHGCV
jgi:hypothetical protein